MKKTYICQTCGDKINNNDNGMLEWYTIKEVKDGRFVADGFRIVHNNDDCTYDFEALYQDEKSLSDRHLSCFDNMSALEVLNDINETYFVRNEDIILQLFK